MAEIGMLYNRPEDLELKEGDKDPTGGIIAAMNRKRVEDEGVDLTTMGSGSDREFSVEGMLERRRARTGRARASKVDPKHREFSVEGMLAKRAGQEPPKPKGIGTSAKRAAEETGAAMLGHAVGAFNMLRNMVGQLGAGGEMMYKTIEQEITGMLTGKPQDLYTEADMEAILDTWTRDYDISDISPRAQEHKRMVEHVMEEFIKPFSEAKEAYMEQSVTPVPVVNMDGKVVAYSRPYPTILAAAGGAGLELSGSVAMIELPLAGIRAPIRAMKAEPLSFRKVSPGDVDVITMPSMSQNLMKMEARAKARIQHGRQAATPGEGLAAAEARAGVTGEYQGPTGTPGEIWKSKEAARKRGPIETPLPKSDVVSEPTIIDAKQGTIDTLYKTKSHDPVQFQKQRAARQAADAGGGTLYMGGVYRELAIRAQRAYGGDLKQIAMDVIGELKSRGKGEWVGDKLKVWHLTTKDAAAKIKKSGFRPFKQESGAFGISVSANKKTAIAMRKALDRMNSFKSLDAVDLWAEKHGAIPEELSHIRAQWEKNIKRREKQLGSQDFADRFSKEEISAAYANLKKRKEPGGYYLAVQSNLLGRMAEGMGYKGAIKLPDNQFLWNDMAMKLIGEDVKTVESLLDFKMLDKEELATAGRLDVLLDKDYSGVEAEIRTKKGYILEPGKVYTGGTYAEVGRGLKKIWDEVTQNRITNNASGESAASIEALNRLAEQHDMLFFRTNVNNPKSLEHLIPTVDRVDLRAMKDQIIFAKKIGDPRIIHIESGPNLNRARSNQVLEGIQQRANSGSLSQGATVEFFTGGSYHKAAELMKDLIRKVKDSQRVHRLHDAFYVEPRFERLGGDETAFHTKNVNSLSTAIMEDGVKKLIEQTKGMPLEALEEAVLLAEQPSRLKGREGTPEGKVAIWMRKEFTNARQLLERNGIKVNFKERMLNTLTGRLKQELLKKEKTKTDRIKINRLKRAIEKLDDFEFVSIPKNMWMEDLLGSPKTENAALRILTDRKRQTLKLSDMQKFLDKRTNAVDVMASYYHKLGSDIALSKVFKAAVDEGLATLSPSQAKSLGYRKLPAHEAPSFAKYYMHDVLRQYLQKEFINKSFPSLLGQLTSTVKMMTFDSPWYLGYYNLHQAAMLRSWHSMADPRMGTFLGEFKLANKMIRESHPEVMLAKQNGLASTPYPKQVENLIKDMHRTNQGMFRRSFEMVKDMGEWTYKPVQRFKGGKGIGRVPIVSDFYSAAWDIAWNNFDFPVRMTSYNWLRKQGYDPRQAAQTAARFHGDYAAIPRSMRVKLNKILYTPTFKLAMLKLHGEILSAALKGEAAGPAAFKLTRRKALGSIGTVLLTNLFFDQLMTKSFGFERKFFGRRYSKEVETENGLEELNITFSSPQNFSFKYAERLSKMFQHGFDPKTAQQVFRANKYEITPLFTILNDTMIRNKSAKGKNIYNTYDDNSTKWKKSAKYAALEINSHLKALFPDKEGMRVKRAMAQEMGASLSFLIRTLANGYLTTTELEKLERKLNHAERQFNEDLNSIAENENFNALSVEEVQKNFFRDIMEQMERAD
jgi:hypothetical protein